MYRAFCCQLMITTPTARPSPPYYPLKAHLACWWVIGKRPSCCSCVLQPYVKNNIRASCCKHVEGSLHSSEDRYSLEANTPLQQNAIASTAIRLFILPVCTFQIPKGIGTAGTALNSDPNRCLLRHALLSASPTGGQGTGVL